MSEIAQKQTKMLLNLEFRLKNFDFRYINYSLANKEYNRGNVFHYIQKVKE